MIKFVNITEKEFLQKKYLFKYMPLENALRTLKDKSLWFANPSTWEDPFERRFLEAKYLNKNKKETKFRWIDRIFCTCMTQTITSEAFWNTYSRGNLGIELRIRRKVFLDELKRFDSSNLVNIYIGKVEYMKTDDIKKDLKDIPFNPPIKSPLQYNDVFTARLFLLKRTAFEYEDELRFIIVKDKVTKEKGIVLNYGCDNTELIHSIVLDPRMGDYTYDMLKDIFIEEYGFTPKEVGGKIYNRVLRSQLFMKPKQATLHLDL